MTQALTGIRVIDMTHNQAGPACAQILAFLGADVIKLEEPKGGDVARTNMRDRTDSDSLFFLVLNANKRSLTLNLKSEEGKRLFRRVIEQSDVLLENFGPGALDRLKQAGIVYTCDWVNDDQPYRMDNGLYSIPYTIELNDRPLFREPWATAWDYERMIKASFDVLYREGKTAPKMMSVGLHTRLAGRPGRAAALERFLDYVVQHDDVWIARRVDIARHWIATHPAER